MASPAGMGEGADIDDAGAVARPRRLAALEAYGILDTDAESAFDDLVQLAADLCATPVALVSFVAADRQWFKARVGFPRCGTDLDSSVCRFALAEPDLLVIPDLSQDPRTAANPLVTAEPNIRFYAGAPLRTPEGEVLGSLCVIDTAPRPSGLSAREADTLRRLARQAMGQLALRRAVFERDAALRQQAEAVASLGSSERRWRGLFENLQEGFLLARVIRDDGGRIVDWRYLDVNRAWGELVGLDERGVIGRTVTELLPGVEQEWIDLGGVVDGGGTVTFTRQVGQLGRWYDGRASAVDADTFLMLFLEVTDRVRAEQALAASAARKTALAELGDALRDAGDVAAMARIASDAMGRTLSACRAGYGTVDPRLEQVDVVVDWCAPGFASVAGLHRFRDYGSYIEDLKQGRLVVIADIRTDPRTRDIADGLAALGIEALINVPIVEHGALVAITFVHFDRIRSLADEEVAFVRAAADRTTIGIARLRADERQRLLNGEISHRLKNTLAMVQAIANQTLRRSEDRAAVVSFEQRLMALGRAQDVLLQSEWQGAELNRVAAGVLELAGVEDRCTLAGPPVALGPRSALSASLLLHELATNARKYGALSVPGGSITVEWRLEHGGDDAEVVLDWREHGGPAAEQPTRKGFGSRLLRVGLSGTGGAQLRYEPQGFSASFRAVRRQVAQT